MDTFDYIIIGAGSAGCVLANRLTADPKNRVLLLEAGRADKNVLYHLPVGVGLVYFFKVGNWAFRAQPRQDSGDNTIYFPRGKVLGGSSSINGMIYIRGHPRDYDDWAALGNEGWSFQDVLPYFKKAENHELGASDYHGANGPLSVSTLKTDNILDKKFIEAAISSGYPSTDDFNGVQQEGFGAYHTTTTKGKRCSTAVSYLKPIKDRPNLTILTEAHVTKLLVKNKQVSEVEFLHKGNTRKVKANKEVLLCAGAIQSPQILMLSGIGQANELENIGIDCIHDLPGVGKNLLDHQTIKLACKARGGYTYGLHWKGGYNFIVGMIQYFKARWGLLATSGLNVGGFIKTTPDLERPDIQYHLELVLLKDGEPNPTYLLGDGLVVATTLLRPYSQGQVRLNSPNPLDPPKIELNYLSDERDLETLLNGLKKMREIMSSNVMKPYIRSEESPGNDVQTNEALKDHIKRKVETIYHPTSTCRMGVDKLAVVDSRLRVHGLKGLRVVDASVMPTIIGGNTNAPTIMIAEKAADMILEDSE